MLSPLVAALACVIAPSPSSDNVSLPEAMLSSPLVVQSVASRAVLPPEVMTPIDIDCVATAQPRPDCTTLVSRDEGGSCSIVAPVRGRIVLLQRGRAHDGRRRVASGGISSAPELLAPDVHDPPPLGGSCPSLPLPRLSLLQNIDSAASPPAALRDRIDRPPRA